MCNRWDSIAALEEAVTAGKVRADWWTTKPTTDTLTDREHTRQALERHL